LYAMPLGAGRVFVEETVLVSRPAVPFDVLEARLQRRCAALGIPIHRIVEREQVWIPMGGGIPSSRERVIGFGGAAGMVHPATGYLLPRVLEAAPALADAVYQGLEAGDSPQGVARAAWNAIWPADRRRRHALFRFGMETMLRMDAPRMQSFFAAFFSLPDAQWQGYLGDRLSTPEISRVMARVLASAPYGVRGTLLRSALSRPGARLAAALLASRRT
jgi:lycopene cyclase-like protein